MVSNTELLGALLPFTKLQGENRGNPNRGLANGGLARKAPIGPKRGAFGAISALPLWLWGAEELVPIGPEQAAIGPEKAPICPENFRFPRKDFLPIFSENIGVLVTRIAATSNRKSLATAIATQKITATPKNF